MVQIELTNEEIYWAERTADIESSMCLKKFADIVSIPKANINETELQMLTKYSTELINTYNILKSLRFKFERLRNANS